VGDGTFSTLPTILTSAMIAPTALTIIDFDPQAPGGPDPDLAVLDFGRNRTDLFRNDGGLSFTPAPVSPASPWKDTSAMSLFGADASVAADAVLLQRSSHRIDVLSGIGNGYFRALPSVTLKLLCVGGPRDGLTCATGSECADPMVPANNGACKGATSADAMVVADFKDDSRPDLAVLDSARSRVTTVTNEVSGVLTEGGSVTLTAPPASGGAGSLLTDLDDYDRDGVPNLLDNCPTRYNPPHCRVTDPACAVDVQCINASLAPTNCNASDPTTFDPLTGQCDSDHNGIGDQCQLLDSLCLSRDSDGDLRPDYLPDAIGMVGGQPDFDRDGVANALDNCPTKANADQKDANGNGIGDACEVLDTLGNPIDADGDGKFEYDPNFDPLAPDRLAAALDNCPTVPNPMVCSNLLSKICSKNSDCPPGGTCAQPDNDGDHVGNACVIAAALDNCPWRPNTDQADALSAAGLDRICGTSDDVPALNGPDGFCGTLDDLKQTDGVGDFCERPVQDLAAVSPAAGSVSLLIGDGSGDLREASFSPITGFANPSGALIGSFSLNCNIICDHKTTNDLLVAEQVDPLNAGDDRLTVFIGNGTGGLSATPPVPTQGNPTSLLVASAQPVCPIPAYPGQPDPLFRFAGDVQSTVVAVVQPGTSSLGIFIPSSQNQIDPSKSPLVPPPAHPAPLPVPGPLVAATFADMNHDGVMDLVALSSGDGNATTPSVTIYIGLRNGLYFTDSTFNPLDVPDGAAFIDTTNSNLQTESFLPDVVLFNRTDGAPWVLTNVLKERADIDGSKRVDGFDLALLAHAFGAARGEDFVIQADGTLLQSGVGYTSVVTGTGVPTVGQDLPDSSLSCSRALETVSPQYGLAFDINLDGVVDGTDLAILASLFGAQL